MRSSTAGWNRGPDYAGPPELSWAPCVMAQGDMCVLCWFRGRSLRGREKGCVLLFPSLLPPPTCAPLQLSGGGGDVYTCTSTHADALRGAYTKAFLCVFSLAGSFRCFFFLLFLGALYVAWFLFYVGLFSVRTFF
jgi:hypothetical protein